MSDLSNKLINNTYKKLLQVSTSGNVGVDSNLTNVQTGDGTNTAIKISTSAIQVIGTFGVSGDASVVGDLQVTDKVCASLFYGDGSNLTNVPTSGDVSVSTLRVTHNASIGGTLSVVGAVGLNSTLVVAGNTTIDGTLHVKSSANFATAVTIAGATHLQSTVSVAGATTIGGAANLLSTATVSGAAGFLGTVRVSGATSLEGAVLMKSTATILGTAHITGNVSLMGTVVHAPNAKVCASSYYGEGSNLTGITTSVGGNVSVTNLIVGGTATVSGAAGFLGTVRVSGATSLEAGLVVGGKAEFNNDVCVSGNTQLVGTLKTTGATTITGATGFLGTVRVSGATSLEGTLKVIGGAAAAVCATAINGVTSVSLNFATAQNWRTSVTAAHTLAQPINCVTGQTGSIFLTQDGGSGTMAYHADFKFIGGTDPTLSTGAGAVDRLDYIIVSASANGVGGDIQTIISQAYA